MKKKKILESIDSITSLCLRLPKGKDRIAITPEIIMILQPHGYTVDELIETLRVFERKGICVSNREA